VLFTTVTTLKERKKKMEDSLRRANPNKRLHVNQRVSGALGEYIDGPTKRRRRNRIFGHIISAVGERKYLVRFDDGTEKECPSAVLRVEKVAASLPPDVQLPVPATHVEAVEAEDVQEEVADQDEEEALPEAPEVEEEEVAAEKQAGEEESEEVAAETSDSAPSGMIGQLPTESEVANSTSGKDYATLKKLAWDKVKSLLGSEVVVKTKKNGSMTWKVIESIDNDDVIPEHNNSQYGLKKFSCGDYKKSDIIAKIFLRLMFNDWREKVEKLNNAVIASKAKCRLFTGKEFLTGLAIIIGAAEFARRGSDLFGVKDQVADDDDDDTDAWPSLCQDPHFEQYMPFSRWKDLRRFFPEIFADETKKETDPWYQFSSAIDEFNSIRQSELVDSLWISIDETMSAWKPRKTALGGLPNISFIVRKPEPLGKTLNINFFNTKIKI
jgi:hypothetical protein